MGLLLSAHFVKTRLLLKNAPTCYRAPRWPDPEFPKKYPPDRNSGTPRKHPQNTEKIPRKYAFSVFSGYFFGIFRVFWGYFLGFQNFGPGDIFSVFFVEIPGRAISGLCSRSGRSQASAEIRGEFIGASFWMNFAVFIFVDFLWFVLLEKNIKKHPRIHSKIQIRICELRGQNPHCKDLALTFL